MSTKKPNSATTESSAHCRRCEDKRLLITVDVVDDDQLRAAEEMFGDDKNQSLFEDDDRASIGRVINQLVQRNPDLRLVWLIADDEVLDAHAVLEEFGTWSGVDGFNEGILDGQIEEEREELRQLRARFAAGPKR